MQFEFPQGAIGFGLWETVGMPQGQLRKLLITPEPEPHGICRDCGQKFTPDSTIKMLPGETHREFVLSPGEEYRYLAACPPLLAHVATVLVDSGMRPEELNRLRWESVRWIQGRYGSLHVTFGKTVAARRMLPMTARVRAIIEERWQQQGQPLDGWIWPALTKSGHLEPSGVKKQHRRALRDSRVRTFVLYSLRHYAESRNMPNDGTMAAA